MTTPTIFVKSFTATYPGDRSQLDTSVLVGPNTMGEWFRPVKAVYDAVSDSTRVWFDLVPRDEVVEYTRRTRDRRRAALRLRLLFGGAR